MPAFVDRTFLSPHAHVEAATGVVAGTGRVVAALALALVTFIEMTVDDEGNKVLKSGILTNVRVAADVRANSLVVTAPPESMSLIAALVEQLDELPTSEATIKVFQILNQFTFILFGQIHFLYII